jgi:hypothetical protein
LVSARFFSTIRRFASATSQFRLRDSKSRCDTASFDSSSSKRS